MRTSAVRVMLMVAVVAGGSCFAANVDYTTQIQPIFNSYSCTGCHIKNGAAGMNLTSPDSYSNLVNVAATTTTGVRVKPKDPTNSVLLKKISTTHHEKTVSAADIQTLTDWINQGALAVPPDPSTPVISSAATATPNPAQIVQSVSFTVAATDPNGKTLTYSWDFGDSTTSTDAAATHAYAANGSYTAVVTVSNGTTSATSSVTVTVSPPVVLTLSKFSGKATFGKTGKDSASLTGTLSDIPAGFDPTGKVVILNVGGAIEQFTLNAKGTAKATNGSFTLKLKTVKKVVVGGTCAFQASLTGTYSTAWGFNFGENVKKSPITMTVDLNLSGTSYTKTFSGTLNVSANKNLTFKF